MKPKVKKQRVIKDVYWLDGTGIDYVLTFKNVKNYNLRIKPSKEVCVSAPLHADLSRVHAFLAANERFLRRALALQTMPPRACDQSLAEQPLHDGVTLHLLGRKIRLRIDDVDQPHGEKSGAKVQQLLGVEGEPVWRVIVSPDVRDEAKREQAISHAVISEEITLLQATVNHLLPLCQTRVRAAAEALRISGEMRGAFPHEIFVTDLQLLRFRDMKSRWGSCNVVKGVIAINSRLIFTTEDCVTYVLCHELCHFYYPNHSAAFYRLLQAAMPNASVIKEQLNGIQSFPGGILP